MVVRVNSQKIRDLLAASGWRQWYLAYKAGLSSGHLSNVLKNGRARERTVCALAAALRVDVTEISAEATE